MLFKKLFLSIFLLICLNLYASSEVQLIKKQNSDSNTTLLVIGGIHGDEPGGYFAASVLATHYKILSKNLWIVPDLNRPSIQVNQRGLYGDMNRKFSFVKDSDKDKKRVEEIKKIILQENISLVLNLHDGNGFYRKEHQGNIFNPNAWGQTCVIDQNKLQQEQEFGNLDSIASIVTQNINKKLIKQHHTLGVRNTNTKFEDEAMQLSLTYFAVTNNKPAFAIETSKHLPTLSQKVFYQLLAIEEFMKIMNIDYKREFDLNEKELDKILSQYGVLNINNNISLNLHDIKPYLSYIPLKSSSNVFKFSHILGSIKKTNGSFVVYLGNKKITTLRPQYFEIVKKSEENFDVIIDGKLESVNFTSTFFVTDDFHIVNNSKFRVNIIGYRSSSASESGVDISLKNLDKNFSVDKSQKLYRVEFYKDGKFYSMAMAYFK
ncbi:MAG: M14/M99 family metallopeptidase [Sulfurimonas sp.]|uniref:M99 family carboxypeptidase catalytic domain-containing protein n=1 Tax=Sulfurimonas sp. TaxID=2022749 RepID=UPI0025E31EFD|nr:M99 family carboxypeptidase catalytic domain-containing protein [Sulfurimonas sp.]MCK9491028.1 M14/M99 family metallopeptidase [Sulfurimonas sp.]